MDMDVVTKVLKRIESLLWLALSKSATGSRAGLASAQARTTSNVGAIGPAATVAFSGALFPTVGLPFVTGIDVTGDMTVTGTGGTSTAGEVIAFQLLQDGTPFGPIMQQELSATHNVCSAAVTSHVSGIAAGANHTWGIQATNLTTPAHTLEVSGTGLAAITMHATL